VPVLSGTGPLGNSTPPGRTSGAAPRALPPHRPLPSANATRSRRTHPRRGDARHRGDLRRPVRPVGGAAGPARRPRHHARAGAVDRQRLLHRDGRPGPPLRRDRRHLRPPPPLAPRHPRLRRRDAPGGDCTRSPARDRCPCAGRRRRGHDHTVVGRHPAHRDRTGAAGPRHRTVGDGHGAVECHRPGPGRPGERPGRLALGLPRRGTRAPRRSRPGPCHPGQRPRRPPHRRRRRRPRRARRRPPRRGTDRGARNRRDTPARPPAGRRRRPRRRAPDPARAALPGPDHPAAGGARPPPEPRRPPCSCSCRSNCRHVAASVPSRRDSCSPRPVSRSPSCPLA